MASDLDDALAGGRTVVELGPGTGAFTSALIRHKPGGSAYVGIELDRRLVRTLQSRFPGRRFPGTHLIHGSAEHAAALVAGLDLPPVGLIVCGLPFASLPRPVRTRIVQSIDGLLHNGGAFRTFQYVHAGKMRSAQRFRRQMDRRFGPGTRRRAVVGNVPPAYVWEWERVGGMVDV
jgi:phospholipid N-methyltransferase